MKPIQGTHKSSKSEPEDFISNMPYNVVTDIMDRLPLKDAVRTCILSRNWRFNWTLLSQLVFDKTFFECFKDAKGKTDIVRIISWILLHIRGDITRFVLSIDKTCYSVSVREEISHWIVFLARSGTKDITLEMKDGQPLELSAHFLSCMGLKHMKLINCCFCHPTSFHGFPNLLSLRLHSVKLENKEFVNIITQCPILENLEMNHRDEGTFFDFYYEVKLKLAEIAKLANLKRLSLRLYMVDKTSCGSILELVGFHPKLEELCLYMLMDQIPQVGVVAKRCPNAFSSLKTLNMSEIDISSDIGLPYALQLISSFPNLQNLKINSYVMIIPSYTSEIYSPGADYNTMVLPHLQNVVLTSLSALENEVCLIKYLLARSPSLQKICIRLIDNVAPEQKYMFATKLLMLHRASSEVLIDLH